MSINSICVCCSFDLLGGLIEVVLTIQQSISLCVTTLRVFFFFDLAAFAFFELEEHLPYAVFNYILSLSSSATKFNFALDILRIYYSTSTWFAVWKQSIGVQM